MKKDSPNPSDFDDDDLKRGLRQGDEHTLRETLGKINAKYGDSVVGMVWWRFRQTLDPDDIEGLYDKALVEELRRPANRETDDIQGQLLKITTSRAKDLRRKKKILSAPIPENWPAKDPDRTPTSERVKGLAEIIQGPEVMGKLSERDRAIIALDAQFGGSAPSDVVADEIGVPAIHVPVYRARARKRLKKAVRKVCAADADLQSFLDGLEQRETG